MIYQSVTITIVAGKQEEAMRWLKKLAQYQKEHFGVEVKLIEGIDGVGGRYFWVEKYDSLASWESTDKMFWADSGILALLKEAEGLFNPPELHFWRDVDLSA